MMTTYTFSTHKLGRSIARCRKEKNLTQSELAERLGVTHQAISSWENGLTCPDISKLSELSSIFEVSIDEIFENDTFGKIITKVEQDEPLEEDEIVAVAPLTKPKELESIINHAQSPSFKFKTMIALAPFADEGDIEKWLEHLDEKADLKHITPLAPFMSSKSILNLIKTHRNEDNVSLQALVELAPFLDEIDLDDIIQTTLTTGSIKDIVPLAPFASEKALSKLVRSSVNEGSYDVKELVGLAPFLQEDDFDFLFKHVLDHVSIDALVPLAPFASEASLSEVVETLSQKESFNPKQLVPLAPFLDRKVIKKIVESSIHNGNIEDVAGLFPFI